MATKEKLTYEQHMKLIKEDGDHIKNVPVSMVDQKMVKAARKAYANVSLIPDKFVTFQMVLNDAPSYSLKDAKEFAYRNLDSKWGISDTAFAQLSVKAKMPSMKKVPEQYRDHVEFAVFNKLFGHRGDFILKMPEKVLEKMKKKDGFFRRAFNSTYHVSTSRFGSDTWIGYRVLALFTEDELTQEDIDFAHDELKSNVERGNRVDLAVVPEFFITDDLYIAWVNNNGKNLQHIPEDSKTLSICKAAVEKDGDALRYVPEQYKKDFYADAVRNGGLGSIPEEDRTDKLCTMAVEIDPKEIRSVPEEKRTYAICLMAVDANAEMLEFVPQENRDEEMAMRFFISVLKKNYNYDFSITRDWREEGKKPLIHEAFDIVVDFENTRYSHDIREKKEEFMQKLIKREPSCFPMLVNKSQNGQGWPMLENLVTLEICVEAFKGDKDNISSIPKNHLIRMVSDYIDLRDED
jgi:hypothetical protein